MLEAQLKSCRACSLLSTLRQAVGKWPALNAKLLLNTTIDLAWQEMFEKEKKKRRHMLYRLLDITLKSKI